MKKVFVIASVGMLLFASCKKDYTCTCTTTTGGISVTGSPTELKDMKKKDAKKKCEAGNSSSSALGITITTTCELK